MPILAFIASKPQLLQ